MPFLRDSLLVKRRPPRGSNQIMSPDELIVGQRIIIHVFLFRATSVNTNTVTIAEISEHGKEIRFHELSGWYSFFKVGLLPYPDGRWHKLNWSEHLE
jgi:hypothetical protein